MKKLNELFEVSYGNKLDLNKMKPLSREKGGINFVGRSSQNHGVSGTVAEIENIPPYAAGLITVALGGTKLLCSFIQEHRFYTAQNVAILKPRTPMSFPVKLFYCLAIRHNRFRYSAFGREANRTLREISVPAPDEIPAWVSSRSETSASEIKSRPRLAQITPTLITASWEKHSLASLFEFRKGKRLTKFNMKPGHTPFIGAIDGNNGVSAFISQAPIHAGNTITVSYNGSVGEAFYQEHPFWASDDVNVLYPKFELTPSIGLFICTCIRREKFRYNYGRKWHLERMMQTEIMLPTNDDGKPNFEYMENFIKTLPYSSQL